ncbi:unnamed protein product [Haemonchus placei]|uniref:Flocculation protein FLO11-like n=1 Tax=Haemonchus placei TaxID=6290 RepID=A0A0N4WEE0_HAEPC|nr:unnamed protein product [Haemonchus placei]
MLRLVTCYTHFQHIVNSIKYNLNVSCETFTTDDEELPATKQLLGLVTRDHNVDSVVKLLKEATLSATTLANSTVSTQSTSPAVTSPKVDAVVTSVQVAPSPSNSPSPSAMETAHSGQPST